MPDEFTAVFESKVVRARVEGDDGSRAFVDVTAKRQSLGKLQLPSGRLCVADPVDSMRLAYDAPMQRQVPPGAYPVEALSVRLPQTGVEVCLVQIAFSKHAVVKWEPATWDASQPPASLLPTNVPILDARRLTLLDETSKALLEDESFVRTADDARNSVAVLMARGRALLVSCGDGGDESSLWWGLGADGTPVRLVIDRLSLDFVRPAIESTAPARAAFIRSAIAKLDDDEHRDGAAEQLAPYRAEAVVALPALYQALSTGHWVETTIAAILEASPAATAEFAERVTAETGAPSLTRVARALAPASAALLRADIQRWLSAGAPAVRALACAAAARLAAPDLALLDGVLQCVAETDTANEAFEAFEALAAWPRPSDFAARAELIDSAISSAVGHVADETLIRIALELSRSAPSSRCIALLTDPNKPSRARRAVKAFTAVPGLQLRLDDVVAALLANPDVPSIWKRELTR